MDKKRLVPILVLMMLSATVAGAAILVFKSFTATGTFVAISGLGLYSDAGCTTSLTPVAWGDLHRGDTKMVLVWIKNTGEGTITLSWDYTMTGSTTATWQLWDVTNTDFVPKGGSLVGSLAPGAVRQVRLDLACGPAEVFGNVLAITTTINGNG